VIFLQLDYFLVFYCNKQTSYFLVSMSCIVIEKHWQVNSTSLFEQKWIALKLGTAQIMLVLGL